MAIYRVSGQMLQSTLVRDGNNIAFANTASSVSTLFVDIANTRVGINSNVANVTLDVNGNIAGGNIGITGLASATGNITGGNIITVGLISATGNLTSGNVNTVTVSATGNVEAGNVTTVGLITATGNVIGGNILTIGFISATGNLTSGNVNTTLVSATGNVVAGNVVVGNILLPATGNVTVGNVNINNLSEPVVNSDAATKFYVDSKIGNVANIGNLTVDNTTISSLNSNLVAFGGNAGIIIPVGNTTSRPSPATQGTVRFNSDTLRIEVYDGSEWDQIVSGVTNETLNGDGSTTTFTLNRSTTSAAVLIMLNGVVQLPGSAYNMSPNPSTTLIFTEAPSATDVIDVRYL